MPPTDIERGRARRYRKARKQGTITAVERAWLDEYERTQQQTRAHDQRSRRDGGTTEAGPAHASNRDQRSPAPSSVPIHTTEVVMAPEAGGWTAPAMLPPGEPPPEGEKAPPSLDGDQTAAAQGETPLVDEPAKAGPTEDQINRGAARFAAAIVGVNVLGIKAALELAPAEALERLDQVLAEHVGASISKLSAGALGVIHASAVEVAKRHPILCASIPYEHEVVVVGSTLGSLAALYVRHVAKPKDEEPTVERAAPPAAKPAAPSSPSAAPPRPVDFASLKVTMDGDA